MTLIFDFGSRGACGWCGLSSSIRVPSLKFVGLAIQKIWLTMCVRLMGLVTLIVDLLTLKLVCELHQRCGMFILNLGTLGLSVLQLFAMYATDRPTDGWTDGQKQHLMSPSLWVGTLNTYVDINNLLPPSWWVHGKQTQNLFLMLNEYNSLMILHNYC